MKPNRTYNQSEVEEFAQHFLKICDLPENSGRKVGDLMEEYFAKREREQWENVFNAAQVEKITAPKFTGGSHRQLVQMLLTGDYYLLNRKRHSGQDGFVLMKHPANPVKWYSRAAMKFLHPVLRAKGKHKLFILNLSLVRQQHGKSLIKQEYKRHRKNLQQ